jgi:hypothetical protein
MFWKTGKRRALNSYIDAWDIPLAEGMVSTNFFTLVPPVNLISNLGFDSSATHTVTPTWPLNLPRSQSYPDPTTLNLEESARSENDQFMRSKVYGISGHHILSGALALVFDPLRFMKRQKSASLYEKTRIEESKYES